MHKMDPAKMRRALAHVEYLRRELSLRVARMEAAPSVTMYDIAMLEELEDEVRLRAEEAAAFRAGPARIVPAAAR